MHIISFLIKLPLLKRLLPSLIRRVLIIIKHYHISFSYKNIILTLDIRDGIDRSLLFKHEYENSQIEELSRNIDIFKINTFIDVGSNIGIYSLLIAHEHKNIKVYAFEPHPSAFKRLNQNIGNNNLNNQIKAINKGLSEKEGSMTLYQQNYFGINQSGGAAMLGNSTIDKDKNKNFIVETIVPITTADKELNISGSSIAIKIDVEKYELNVLKGFENIFAKNNVYLQIEIFDEFYSKVAILLEKYGFKLIKSFDDGHSHNSGSKDYVFRNFDLYK